MAAVVSRCYTAATRSIAAMSVLVAVVTTSSRTAGKTVDAGCLRSSRAGGGRSKAVLVSLVAVSRCCTAEGRAQTGTSRARAMRTRCGTWSRAS